MNRTPRRGSSLIEVSVVIAIASVVFSAAGVCLHGMMRADKRQRAALARRSAIARVSVRFRTDAHQASGATRQGEATLVFALPDDRSIQYAFGRQRITRTVRDAGRTVHRDAFRLSRGDRVEWQVARPFAQTTMAALVIMQSADGAAGIERHEQRIEAAVGLGRPNAERAQEEDAR